MFRLKSDHSQTGSKLGGSYSLTADFFLFFASPAALMIFNAVHRKEMTSQAISEELGITSRIVVDKLKAMEKGGILESFVKSKETFYQTADSKIAKAFEQILELPQRRLKEAATLSMRSIPKHGKRAAGTQKLIL